MADTTRAYYRRTDIYVQYISSNNKSIIGKTLIPLEEISKGINIFIKKSIKTLQLDKNIWYKY